MGLKGSLSATPFSSVLQTLAGQNASGLLRVNAPDGAHFLEFSDGLVTTASRTSTRNPLGELLIARGIITEEQFTAALNEQKASGVMLGEVLLRQNAVTLETLETMLRFQVEEEIYDLFETPEGEFEFLQGAHLDKQLHATKGLVKLRVPAADLTAEAARRAEDWKQIRERVPDSGCLMNLTAEGSRLMAQDEGLSIEGKTILRQVALRRSADAIAQKACLGRYNTYRMMMELTDVGLLQPATPQEYIQAAENALEKREFEEARRLAGTVARFFASPHKERAEQLLKRIAEKIAPKTTSARVVASPGAAQEISRRAGTGRALVEAAPSSKLPLVLGLLVVLLGGGGAYWYFSGVGRGGDSGERRRLDQIHSEAMDAIAGGKLDEGLEKLKSFSSTDPEVTAAAKELLQKRQQDVDSRVEQALDAYASAQSKNDAAALQAAIEGLQRIRSVALGSKPLDERRAQFLQSADARSSAQRSQDILAKLQSEIAGASKGLSAESLTKLETELRALPPETVLDTVSVALTTGHLANTQAARLLERVKGLRGLGDLEAAQAEIAKGAAFPTSPSSQELQALATEIVLVREQAQTTLKNIQAGASKGQVAEALKLLRDFLAQPHPSEYHSAALDLYQSLEKAPDREFTQKLNAALQLYETDPAASRTQSDALAAQHPYSKAVAGAAQRVKLTTIPEGAAVSVNGRSVGRTPTTVSVPLLGATWIALELPGYESTDIFRWNLRDATLDVTLNRLPSATKRLPFAAVGGLDCGTDRLLMLGANALAICARSDLKNVRVYSLTGNFAPPANDPFEIWPPVETPYGGALILGREGPLLRATFATGSIQKTSLQTAAVGGLALARPTTRGSERWVLIPTRNGMEAFDLATGSPRKTLPLSGTLPETASAGVAAEDGVACFTRGKQLQIVNLENSSTKPVDLGEEADGPPVLAGSICAVALKSGAVWGINTKDGGDLWKVAGAAPIMSLQNVGTSIVVQRELTLDLLAAADGKSEASIPLRAASLLPIAALENKNVITGFASAVRDGDAAALLVTDAKGALLWKSRLHAAPAALLSRGETIFVSLADGQLLRFEMRTR